MRLLHVEFGMNKIWILTGWMGLGMM